MDLKNILHIYTDCSIYQSDFGFGVLFIDGEDEKRYQYRTTLNHIYAEYNMREKCSTDFAETYAIIKAIENIHKKYDKIIIYMDNETAYHYLNNLNKKKIKNILTETVINTCLDVIKDLPIDIRWIKGHCGIYGNVIADKLAKNSLRRKKKIPICNLNTSKEYKEYMTNIQIHNNIYLQENKRLPGLTEILHNFQEYSNGRIIEE